eukprot:SAG22_NODE_10071_length_554_cov_1.525275_1_plen_23_part_10
MSAIRRDLQFAKIFGEGTRPLKG